MQKKIKLTDGFTLIEVLVSIFILSIFALILVQGIRMTLTAFNINKTKTQALMIANEEIEKIRSMPFNEIDFAVNSSSGVMEKQKLTENGFLIEYEVNLVNNDDRIKQVTVSVMKEPMKKKLEIVTEIIAPPFLGNNTAGSGLSQPDYPPPENLRIVSEKGNGKNREIILEWDDPVTSKYKINTYRIYRKPSLIDTTTVRSYIDHPGNSREYYYYITIIYSDGTESSGSNEVRSK